MSKLALGKGLGALIQPRSPSVAPPQKTRVAPTLPTPGGEAVRKVAIDRIVASPFQPRTDFRGERLGELMESIREHGIIQPLVVRQRGDRLELIAGERRLRAARQAGLTEVPAILREASDQEVLELALIENLQREDLNPIEEALAYQRLAGEFSMKQEEIARRVGRSRASVANSLRLLDLAPEVRDAVGGGRLSVGHAKVLLGASGPEEQERLAAQVVAQSLSVRATERLLEAARQVDSHRSQSRQRTLPEVIDRYEKRLTRHLETAVTLRHEGRRGRIEIAYGNEAELKRLMTLLGIDDEKKA